MTDLYRVRVAFTGFPGAPGVATFYFLDTTTCVADLRTMWNEISGYFPGDVHVTVEPSGDVINDANGEITAAWSVDAESPIVGGGSGGYSAASGALFTWHTSSILDGKRLKGRNYIVPLVSSIYSDTGTIQTEPLALIAGKANDFRVAQAESFVVWHRPKYGPPATLSGERPLIHAGGHGLVTGSSVAAKVAVLRSRRD